MNAVGYTLGEAEGLPPGEAGEIAQGYSLRDPAGKPVLGWSELSPADGLVVFLVDGIDTRGDEAHGHNFEPGRPVRLVSDPDTSDDPDAIAVRSGEGYVTLGYVSPSDRARVTELLDSGQPMKACVLVQWRNEERLRKGAAVLLARDGLVGGMEGPVMQRRSKWRELVNRLFGR